MMVLNYLQPTMVRKYWFFMEYSQRRAMSRQVDLLRGLERPWELAKEVFNSPNNLAFLFISARNLL